MQDRKYGKPVSSEHNENSQICDSRHQNCQMKPVLEKQSYCLLTTQLLLPILYI